MKRYRFTGATKDNHLIIKNNNLVKKIFSDQKNYKLYFCENVMFERSNTINLDTIYIEDPAFVLNAHETAFYHFFISGLGEYLLIKNILKEFGKDLKLIILHDTGNDENIIKNTYKETILNTIKNIEYIKYETTDRIIFNELFFIDTKQNLFLSKNFSNYDFNESNTFMDINLHYLISMQSHINKNFISNYESKKIFLTRGNSLNGVKKTNKFFKNINDLNDFKKNKKFLQDFFDEFNINNFDDIDKNIFLENKFNEYNQRYISDDEEKKIVDYFLNNEYEIINPEEIGIKKQIELCMKASHVATLTGSNSVSSIFCNQHTKFILLNNNTNYEFFHPKIVKTFIKNNLILFDKDVVGKKFFSIDDIIIELTNNHKGFIN